MAPPPLFCGRFALGGRSSDIRAGKLSKQDKRLWSPGARLFLLLQQLVD
jgi:hypothetical protein